MNSHFATHDHAGESRTLSPRTLYKPFNSACTESAPARHSVSSERLPHGNQ